MAKLCLAPPLSYSIMPFLFARRPSSSSSPKDAKEQLRAVVSKAPSSLSLKSGKSAEHSSAMDTIKRHSKMLTDRRPSHGASKSPRMEPRRSAKIDMKVESPPLVSPDLSLFLASAADIYIRFPSIHQSIRRAPFSRRSWISTSPIPRSLLNPSSYDFSAPSL